MHLWCTASYQWEATDPWLPQHLQVCTWLSTGPLWDLSTAMTLRMLRYGTKVLRDSELKMHTFTHTPQAQTALCSQLLCFSLLLLSAKWSDVSSWSHPPKNQLKLFLPMLKDVCGATFPGQEWVGPRALARQPHTEGRQKFFYNFLLSLATKA